MACIVFTGVIESIPNQMFRVDSCFYIVLYMITNSFEVGFSYIVGECQVVNLFLTPLMTTEIDP